MINRLRGGHERPQSNHEWPNMEAETKKDHGQTEILRRGMICECSLKKNHKVKMD